MVQAVSRRPSTRRLGLADRTDRVGFVVDKMALGQVSLHAVTVGFCAVAVTVPLSCTYVLVIYHRNYEITASDFVK
jgi:hypothetical protein